MKEDRLDGLALMMVHRTISVSVKNIIDTFAARHPRRMRLELIQRYAIDHCYECCVDITCACGFVFITMRTVNMCVLLLLNSAKPNR